MWIMTCKPDVIVFSSSRSCFGLERLGGKHYSPPEVFNARVLLGWIITVRSQARWDVALVSELVEARYILNTQS